jgi:hypothetical protein
LEALIDVFKNFASAGPMPAVQSATIFGKATSLMKPGVNAVGDVLVVVQTESASALFAEKTRK